MRGSRRDKIHPRGNPAIVTSIPAVFPQHSYPHPRKTRGFRGIPAIPIPVDTSTPAPSVSHPAARLDSLRYSMNECIAYAEQLMDGPIIPAHDAARENWRKTNRKLKGHACIRSHAVA